MSVLQCVNGANEVVKVHHSSICHPRVFFFMLRLCNFVKWPVLCLSIHHKGHEDIMPLFLPFITLLKVFLGELFLIRIEDLRIEDVVLLHECDKLVIAMKTFQFNPVKMLLTYSTEAEKSSSSPSDPIFVYLLALAWFEKKHHNFWFVICSLCICLVWLSPVSCQHTTSLV